MYWPPRRAHRRPRPQPRGARLSGRRTGGQTVRLRRGRRHRPGGYPRRRRRTGVASRSHRSVAGLRGIGKATSALDFKAEDVAAQIEVNLIGVANSVDAVLAGMIQRRRGHLAVLSSLASYRGLPMMAGYCASKAGVSALFDTLRVELTPLGIAVTTICPGWIRTPLTTNIDVPQPYMMEVDNAVAHMVKALRQRKPYIAFPPRAAWQVRFLRWLPCGLSDWLVRRKFAQLMQPEKWRPSDGVPVHLCRSAEPLRLSAGSALESPVRVRQRDDGRRVPRPNGRRLAALRPDAVPPALRRLQRLSLAAHPRGPLPPRPQSKSHRKANDDVRLIVGPPTVTREKLELYDRYHAFQADHRDWPIHDPKDADGYADSFVRNPFPVQEWCYYLGRRLVGVGYVDDLPGSLSAIYFFYDPEVRRRSPGTFNILSLIDGAARRGLEHVYLGYYVAGCSSMEYKPRFRPNQLLGSDGDWHDYLP